MQKLPTNLFFVKFYPILWLIALQLNLKKIELIDLLKR